MPLLGHKSRIVVITQGADDVIIVDDTGKLSEIPICKVSKEQVGVVSLSSFCYKSRKVSLGERGALDIDSTKSLNLDGYVPFLRERGALVSRDFEE